MLEIGNVFVNACEANTTMIVVVISLQAPNISFLTIYDSFSSNWSGRVSTVPIDIFQAYFNTHYFAML
jgi:hypothetical protein